MPPEPGAPGPILLVTGATGSLGPAVVGRFARDGARLALTGRDRSRLDALAADQALDPARTLLVPGALDTPEAARAVAAAVIERWGRIDVLAHLVGGWAGGTPVVDLPSEQVTSLLDQHLWSTLHAVSAVVPGMVERGFGRVLAVSSPFAAAPRAGGGSYAVAKAAEEALLLTLAREVAGTGVTVNLVTVRTIDAAHERTAARSARNAAWTDPEEIADAFAYLASPGAAAVNGARLPLDGRG